MATVIHQGRDHAQGGAVIFQLGTDTSNATAVEVKGKATVYLGGSRTELKGATDKAVDVADLAVGGKTSVLAQDDAAKGQKTAHNVPFRVEF